VSVLSPPIPIAFQILIGAAVGTWPMNIYALMGYVTQPLLWWIFTVDVHTLLLIFMVRSLLTRNAI
jgi:hypothetical protein